MGLIKISAVIGIAAQLFCVFIVVPSWFVGGSEHMGVFSAILAAMLSLEIMCLRTGLKTKDKVPA